MRDKDLVIAADFGTSGVRAAVYTRHLARRALAKATYGLSFPGPGMAEQNPQHWWLALREITAALIRDIPDLRERCAGIIFAAQMCTVIAVDEEGNPLRPAIIWLDKRSAPLIRRMAGPVWGPGLYGYDPIKLLRWVRMTNGAPALNGMDPPGKMRWIAENEADIWRRTAKCLDMKDWLVHRATGRFTTTPDSANLTWMMDTRKGREAWSESLMKMVGVPGTLLPNIINGNDVAGGLTARAASELGLMEATPVFGGAGDVSASAYGSGATQDGSLHLSLGTSSWLAGFFPSRRLNPAHAYATILGPVGNRPLLIATQESAGSCFNWIANITGRSIREVMNEASQYSGTQSPPLFLPWLAGERVPADDAHLRGGFLGLSIQHDGASLTRAVLEGVALNTRWAFESVARQKGFRHDASMSVVGGAAESDAFCQMLADCLGHTLHTRPEPDLAGVRGAACIAAMGLGWEPQADHPGEEKRFHPSSPRHEYFNQRFREFRKAYANNVKWFHERAKADT